MTLTEAIQSMANGIATAEGYFVNGSRPQRNNNPGDLTVDITGTGIGKDGMFIIYPDADSGWQALYKLVEMMFNDTSHYYNSDMSIREIAQKYTTTDQLAWATTVANTMGVDIDAPISTLVSTAAEIAGIGVGMVAVGILVWMLLKGRSK